MKRSGIPVLLLLIFLAAGSTAVAEGSSGTYRLGPGDVLQITAWGHEELTQVAEVRPDGCITVALVGDLRVASLTPAETGALITESLAVYVRNPRVTVTVKEFRTVAVTVLGEVRSPGQVLVRPGDGILEVLARAGGPTERARLEAVRVYRGGRFDQPEAVVVGRDHLLFEGDSRRNPAVEEGDVVFVPTTGKVDWAKVLSVLTGLNLLKDLFE